ncbi:30786_t:CDS:2, partial [Gigaspora margarita]
LILDVLKGDRSNFVRDNELDAAWKKKKNIKPDPYAYGSRGLAKVVELNVANYGFTRDLRRHITDRDHHYAVSTIKNLTSITRPLVKHSQGPEFFVESIPINMAETHLLCIFVRLIGNSQQKMFKLFKSGDDANGKSNELYPVLITPNKGVNRLIVENPFGMDLGSSRELGKALDPLWREDETYLDTSMNLACHEKSSFTNFEYCCYGTSYIINSEDVRDKKVRVLRCIPPVEAKDIILGQYTKSDNTKLDT